MKTKLLIAILLITGIFQAKAQTQLWGMTQYGGANSAGTIMTINDDGTNYHLEYSFVPITGNLPIGNLVETSSGLLYGVCDLGGAFGSCTIFSYDRSSGTYVDEFDFVYATGFIPGSTVEEAGNGLLYGVADGGGANGSGVIYSFDQATHTYTMVHSFSAAPAGNNPMGNLLIVNNMMYGTTSSGGANGFGTIFSFDISTNTYSDLYSFTSTGGFTSNSKMFKSSSGLLYGMTTFGGTNSGGTLFSFNLTNNAYNVLANFDNTTGMNPHGSFTESSSGILYGTTYGGGGNNKGTIFSFDPSNNSLTVLYNFEGTLGGNPMCTLSEVNGKLAGTASSGGANNKGVMFNFDLSNSTYSDLFDFNGTNGSNPGASFIKLISTGVSSFTKNAQPVFVFPNPAKDKITIRINNDHLQGVSFVLRNTLGEKLFSSEDNNLSSSFLKTIDISQLSKGIYFLEVMMNDEMMVQKVVKE